MTLPKARLPEITLGLLLFLSALAVRYTYLAHYNFDTAAQDAVWHVQGRGTIVNGEGQSETDLLLSRMKESGIVDGFKTITPLNNKNEEITAHIAPGYPLYRFVTDYLSTILPFKFSSQQFFRYLSILLGGLAVLCYTDLARICFGGNLLVTLCAGLGTALYPIWIINSGEVADGPVVTFLVAACLNLAVRSSFQGGAFKGLLLGLLLGCVALTRAGLIPFCFVTLHWVLWQHRKLAVGWFSSILACVGLLLILTPWTLRNFNLFSEPLPVVSSTWFHLWVGNNPGSDGSDYNWSMDKHIPETTASTLGGLNQSQRYQSLASQTFDYVKNDSSAFLQHRIQSLMQFFFGTNRMHSVEMFHLGEKSAYPPSWLKIGLLSAFMCMVLFAILGWRWSYAWSRTSSLLAVALIAGAVPYILGHAEALHGSRLPFDGVIILFAAVGVCGLMPFSKVPPSIAISEAK